MNKLKILTAALLVSLSGAAAATSIHNDGVNSVDLGGRVEARYNTNDHDISRARLNVTLEHKVNDKVSVIGFGEVEANHRDSVFAKDVYAGFKHNGNALITYGHQNSADDFITDYTDILSYSGASANVRFSGGDNTLRVKNFSKDTVSSFSMTQNDSFSPIWINAGHGVKAESYVGALSHNFGKVSVGGSYGYADFNSESYDDASMYQLATSYNGDAFYMAALGSYMHTKTTHGTSVDAKGIEVAGKYHASPKVDLVSGYNYRHVDVDSFVGMDVTNYYTVGAEYKLDKNLKVYGEYKDDLSQKNDDGFTAAIKYKF